MARTRRDRLRVGLLAVLDGHPWRAAASALAGALVLVLLAGGGGLSLGLHLQATHDHREAVSHHHHHPDKFGGGIDLGDHTDGSAIRVSFVGASVTRGWYVTSLEDGYPALVAKAVARQTGRGVDWKVVALPGARVAEALAWSFPTEQNLVVVDIVTDDFLYGTPLATYEADYTELLQRLRRSSPHAGFVCLGDWGTIGAVNDKDTTAYSFDQVVSATCHAFSGVYVPINQIFDVPGTRGPIGHLSIVGPAHNDFHPNDYGDSLIAQAIVAGVDGDAPQEAVPSGPSRTETPSLLPSPQPEPTPISGHESPVTPTPSPRT